MNEEAVLLLQFSCHYSLLALCNIFAADMDVIKMMNEYLSSIYLLKKNLNFAGTGSNVIKSIQLPCA